MDLRRALSLLAGLACALAAAAIDPSRLLQNRIKGAFLYKFAAYVEWPGEAFRTPDSPLVIGIAGAEELARELEPAIAGREVSGRHLQVQRLKPGEAAIDCCHILFVGADNDAARTRLLLGAVRGRPVLTVTDARDHPAGSVINFVLTDDRVRFDISRETAERNRLQVRAQLLGVARQVVTAQ